MNHASGFLLLIGILCLATPAMFGDFEDIVTRLPIQKIFLLQGIIYSGWFFLIGGALLKLARL